MTPILLLYCGDTDARSGGAATGRLMHDDPREGRPAGLKDAAWQGVATATFLFRRLFLKDGTLVCCANRDAARRGSGS